MPRSLMILATGVCLALEASALGDAAPTTVHVDLHGPATPFKHYWKSSVGSGHAKLGSVTCGLRCVNIHRTCCLKKKKKKKKACQTMSL